VIDGPPVSPGLAVPPPAFLNLEFMTWRRNSGNECDAVHWLAFV
jgi:hypothetical protein